MVWQAPNGQVAVVGIFTDVNNQPNAETPGNVATKRLSHVDRSMTGRQATEKEDKDDTGRTGIDYSFFQVKVPQASTARPSALLETVLSSVGAISKPRTAVKTKPLAMSELVGVLSSGSFQT